MRFPARFLITTSLGIFVGLFVYIGPVQAASNPVGFTMSPAFQNASVSGDTQPVDLSIELSNSTTFGQSFKLSTTDFGSLNETGGIAFIGTPANALDHPYGLVSWLTLAENVIYVPAGGSADIGVEVANRASLAPGGHYGAVLATAITGAGAETGPANVGLKETLSSLILFVKNGGAAPDLSLISETADHTPFHLPTTLVQRFQDAGNIQVVPRGTVTVTAPDGRLVETGVLNEDSDIILPESFRRVPLSLTAVSRSWLPGRYTITTHYRYDGTEHLKTYTDSVWYIGTVGLLIIGFVVSVVLGCSIVWFMRRRKRHRR